MPVRRNADGDVVDELTRREQESGQSDPAGGGEPAGRPAHGVAPTVRIDRGTAARGGAGDARRYGNPTRRGSDRDPRTRIYRPGRTSEPDGAAAPSVRPGPGGAARGAMADPPVGWLVVVAGPGRGNVATLGNGINDVGRSRTARVSLDFGDDTISRAGHGSITYDPRHRKFWVHQSGGTNLTYVDGEPVLAPRELAPLAHVQMGNTVLRFVPLCGPGFSWEDEPDDR